MTDTMKAVTIAAKCADAYSAEAWGPVLWVKAAQMLIDMGLTDEEVEGVLRSVLTREARTAYDMPSTYLGALYDEVESVRYRDGLEYHIETRDGRLHEYTEGEL